jgi:hypothetical protein
MDDIDWEHPFSWFLYNLSNARNNDAQATTLLCCLCDVSPEFEGECCACACPVGYGRELGEALQNNTVVSTLTLNVNHIVDSTKEDEDYQGGSLEACVCQGVVSDSFNPRALDVYSGSASLLLRYIQTSKALRRVILRNGPHTSNLATDYIRSLVVTAIARNPHVTDFECTVKLPAEPLAFLLSTAPSLTALHLDMCHFEEQDVAADNVIVEGLVSNRALQTLQLYRMRDTNLAQAIVLRLTTHPIATLTTFDIQSEYVQAAAPEALPQMVRSCSALEKVSICCHLKGNFWKSLYESLQANPSIKSLLLDCSSFDRQATEDFFTTMHAPRRSLLKGAPNKDTANGVAATSLGAGRGVELHIRSYFRDRTFAGSSSARALAGLLNNATLVNKLYVKNDYDTLRRMFQYLVSRHHSEIQLSCLHMESLPRKAWPFLVQCLPGTTKLRELKIGRIFTYYDKRIKPDSFLAALHANGSLHKVEVHIPDAVRREEGDDVREFMTTAQKRYVTAYTDRNRCVPALLGSEEMESVKMTMALVPLLFAAAQAAPRTAPSMLFHGLQAALEAGALLGPVEGKGMGKRVRSHGRAAQMASSSSEGALCGRTEPLRYARLP